MAKVYRATRAFDVGGQTLTHYEVGDTFPGDSQHLDGLVQAGYVSYETVTKEGEPVNPNTGLNAKEQAAYEDNEGSTEDVLGQQIDIVGDDTPNAEDVKPKATRKSTRKSTSRKSTARRSTSRRK